MEKVRLNEYWFQCIPSIFPKERKETESICVMFEKMFMCKKLFLKVNFKNLSLLVTCNPSVVVIFHRA